MSYIIKGLSFVVMMFAMFFNTMEASFIKHSPESKSKE